LPPSRPHRPRGCICRRGPACRRGCHPSTWPRRQWSPGFGFRVSGFGFRVSGFGFRVSGLGCGVTTHECLYPTLRLEHEALVEEQGLGISGWRVEGRV
jgi:hypothetical protein